MVRDRRNPVSLPSRYGDDTLSHALTETPASRGVPGQDAMEHPPWASGNLTLALILTLTPTPSHVLVMLDRLVGYTPHRVNSIGYLPFWTPWFRGTILDSKTTVFYTLFYFIVCLCTAYNVGGLSDATREEMFHLLTHLLDKGSVKLSTIVIFPLGHIVTQSSQPPHSLPARRPSPSPHFRPSPSPSPLPSSSRF